MHSLLPVAPNRKMSFVGKPYINSDINPWQPVYPGGEGEKGQG